MESDGTFWIGIGITTERSEKRSEKRIGLGWIGGDRSGSGEVGMNWGAREWHGMDLRGVGRHGLGRIATDWNWAAENGKDRAGSDFADTRPHAPSCRIS